MSLSALTELSGLTVIFRHFHCVYHPEYGFANPALHM